MPRPKSAIPTRSLTVRVPVPKYDWLESEAAKRKQTVTALVLRLIERAGGPVEGEGAASGLAATARPSRPEPDHEHRWKKLAWGSICEVCKVAKR